MRRFYLFVTQRNITIFRYTKVRVLSYTEMEKKTSAKEHPEKQSINLIVKSMLRWLQGTEQSCLCACVQGESEKEV